MKGTLGTTLLREPRLRRMAWRASRSLYMASRGEQSSDDIATNGEAYVQACVLASVPGTQKLQCIDIGGNRGDWSVEILNSLSPARRQNGSVRIDIFEPVPRLQARLGSALAATGQQALYEVHQSAVSDSNGVIEIGVMSDHGGTNSVHYASDAGKPLEVVKVPKVTLTSFCDSRGIDRVHLVKSDTEGHDLAVLKGALGLLAAQRIDVLQFEYNHRWIFARAFLKDAFELIAGLPYRIAKVQPGGLDVFEQWHPELERFFPANYAVIAEKALPWFATRQGHFDGANTFG